MNSPININRFLTGLKYGLIGEGILFAIFLPIWYFTDNSSPFPFAYFTFGVGGLLLTIAGCIGPGGYHRDYKLLLYTPEAGSSFSDEIKISGFLMEETIETAQIVVNGQEVGTLDFKNHTTAQTIISRTDFISSVINSIYLKSGDYTSNKSEFTLFEYREDMSPEEIEEYHEMENRQPEKSLEEAERDYKNRMNNRVGSIALGLGGLAILNIITSVILSTYFNINF